MPTLKDIQEKKSEVMLLANTIFTNKASDSFQVLEMFIDKLTTIAYQAGEKSKEDMVLKEIEENKKRFSCAACCGAKCGHTMSCQALSSLKEKIISNNQK